MSDQSVFGDDINSTLVSKLQPAVHSKRNDAPLDPPIYNPDPPIEEKQVRFADEQPKQQLRRPPQKRPPPRRPPQKRVYYAPLVEPPPYIKEPEPETKASVLSKLIDQYGKHAVIFVLILVCLYMYPRISSVPYMGNALRMSWLGILITAGSATGINAVTSKVL